MRWWKESKRILGVLASMTLVSSCALLESQVSEPEVSVANVRVVGMSLADAQIAVDLDVKNPNPVGLSLRGLSYSLALQDKPLFNGVTEEKLEVAAKGNSRITLPFTLRFEDVLGTVLGLAQDKDLRYEISGQADFGLLKLPYSKSGSIGLPKLPDISVQGISIEKFTFSGVELAVNLKVNNANGFPVRFDGMAYDLKIADAPLLKGRSTQPMSVNANGSGSTTLRMAIDYKNLGALGQKLRSASSLPIEFNSRMETPGIKDQVVIPYQWTGNVPLRR